MSEFDGQARKYSKREIMDWVRSLNARNSVKAFLIELGQLSKPDGTCFGKHEAIAVRLGVSTRTIERALRQCIAAGVVERTFRYSEPGKRSGCSYTLKIGTEVDFDTTRQNVGKTTRHYDGKTNRQNVGQKSALPDIMSATTRQNGGIRGDCKGKRKKEGRSNTTDSETRFSAREVMISLLRSVGDTLADAERKDPEPVLSFLRDGLNLEREVLPTLRECVRGRGPNSISSWKYFTPALSEKLQARRDLEERRKANRRRQEQIRALNFHPPGEPEPYRATYDGPEVPEGLEHLLDA